LDRRHVRSCRLGQRPGAGRRLKAVAVAVDQRSPGVPDGPAPRGPGLPAFKAETWTGLYAPKGTPAPVLAKLREAVASSLADPAVQKRFTDIGGGGAKA